MTSVVGHSCPSSESFQRLALRLTFAWRLSAAAARPLGMPVSRDPLRFEIEVPRPPQPGAHRRAPLASGITARLISGDAVREVPLPAAAAAAKWLSDDETSLIHFEAPGILHATLRAAGAGFDVLYTRSPLLASLNIGGGRYDFENLLAQNGAE